MKKILSILIAILLIIPFAAMGANEDFTTYTEVDTLNRLSQTAARSTWTTLARSEIAYLYSDKGVNHFSGDFNHLVDVYVTSRDVDTGVYFGVMSNMLGTWTDHDDAIESLLGAHVDDGPSGQIGFQLHELDSGTPYDATRYLGAVATTYYLRIKRDEAVGTYGTLYLDIYSSAADRTAETGALSNQSLTLHTSAKDFRYMYGAMSYEVGGNTITGYDENLDLQEAAVAVAPNMEIIIIEEE